jgi:CheY-like chemotaxis protein
MMALAERQELMPESVEVPVLLHGMAGLLQRTLGSSIVVELRFPSTLGTVYVDPNQLALVIVKLLRNARDAMPDGGTIVIAGRDDVVASRQGDVAVSHRFVCLSVTDGGDGMDEATLARATEPFFTTKGVGKGTGLALSMAQSFAAQSGGQFVIRSKRGDGTVAELWLPAVIDPAGGLETGANVVAEQIHRPTLNARPLVVLAVDHDRLGLMHTTAMLNKLGHRVFTALSGQDALAVIRRQEGINVVFVDHALPDMTGVALAEAIKIDWPSMPIIFATPLADVSVLQVSKPLRDDEVSKAIARVAVANTRAAS